MTAAPASAAALSVSSMAQLTLSLLAIVALIIAIGWVLKRARLVGPHGRGRIAVLDELALSPRERILLLRVGDSQVLVGVAAGGMVGLTPLVTPIAIEPAPPAPVFAERLRDLMKRAGGAP